MNIESSYDKIINVAAPWDDPILMGAFKNDNLIVFIIATEEVLFKNIKDFKITPCGTPIIVKSESILFPEPSYDEWINNNDFYEYNFPCKIEEIILEHCEMGDHKVVLENKDIYYLDNRLLVVVKKGNVMLGMQHEETECEKSIKEINDEMNEHKNILIMDVEPVFKKEIVLKIKLKEGINK